MEVDLAKPLKARYRMRGKFLWLQYDGLYDLCFNYSQFGHEKPGVRWERTQSRLDLATQGL